MFQGFQFPLQAADGSGEFQQLLRGLNSPSLLLRRLQLLQLPQNLRLPGNSRLFRQVPGFGVPRQPQGRFYQGFRRAVVPGVPP